MFYYTYFSFRHLSKVRNYYGLTQSQLAKQLGVSKNTVSDWENGSQPSLSHFLSICDLFSLPFQFFLDEMDLSFEDVSLLLDVYYASFSRFGQPVFQDLFPCIPVSKILSFISAECNKDEFSWVTDGAVLKHILFTFNLFDLSMPDYSVPPRFSHLFELMLFGGDQDA